jgi:hypothetical protein
MRDADKSSLSRFRPDATVAVLLAALLLPACDSFFGVSGRVTDCGTGSAIADVVIDVHVDNGFQGRMESLMNVATTDTDGKFSFDINDPQESWATLTLSHFAYQSLTPPQFRNHSSQDPPVDLCLDPLPMP